jgi:hypothetical protein
MNMTTGKRVRTRTRPQRIATGTVSIPAHEMDVQGWTNSFDTHLPEDALIIGHSWDRHRRFLIVHYEQMIPGSQQQLLPWFRATAPKRRAPRYQRPPRVLPEDRAYL